MQRLVSRSVGMSADSLQEPVKISIPRYVLRGQGKDEHFEFEVKVSLFRIKFLFMLQWVQLSALVGLVLSLRLQITVMGEMWTVFRRYNRFREMHKSLRLKYPEVSRPPGIDVNYADLRSTAVQGEAAPPPSAGVKHRGNSDRPSCCGGFDVSH